MFSAYFKIKKSTDEEEIGIIVATEKKLIHPDCDVSFAAEHVWHCKKNYACVNSVLSDLIKYGILQYYKSDANEHFFKHSISLGSEDFKIERVTINPVQNATVRTLEDMLYSVCRTHNMPVHSAIKANNLFTTMYDRLIYPSLEQQIENVGIALTAFGGMAGIAAALSIAEKAITLAAKKQKSKL